MPSWPEPAACAHPTRSATPPCAAGCPSMTRQRGCPCRGGKRMDSQTEVPDALTLRPYTADATARFRRGYEGQLDRTRRALQEATPLLAPDYGVVAALAAVRSGPPPPGT